MKLQYMRVPWLNREHLGRRAFGGGPEETGKLRTQTGNRAPHRQELVGLWARHARGGVMPKGSKRQEVFESSDACSK